MSDNLVRCHCCKGMGTLKINGFVEHCTECNGKGKVDASRGIAAAGVNWSNIIGQGSVSRDSMYSVTSGCFQKTPNYFN